MQKKEELLNSLLAVTPGEQDRAIICYLKKPELIRVYDVFQEWKRIQERPKWTQVETIKYLIEQGHKDKAEEVCHMSGEAWQEHEEKFRNTPVGYDTPVHGNSKLIARVMYYPGENKITARYLSLQERKELKYI